MMRRSLLAVAVVGVAASTANACGLARASGRQVTDATVDGLDRAAEVIRRTGSDVGGGTALPLAERHLLAVVALLKGDNVKTETVGRRLYATAAEMMRLCGWLAYDANDTTLAQRYWLGGLRAAHAAGDRAVGANILCFMSDQAVTLGQPVDAVRLAQEARRGYPGGSPRVDALVELQLAKAYSFVGDRTATQQALDSGFARLSRPGPSPVWAGWVDEGTAATFAGSCYRRLKMWAEAERHLTAAFTAPGHLATPLEQAAHRRRFVGIYAHSDPERAVMLGHEALDALSGEVNSPMTVHKMRDMISDFDPVARRQPEVREFCARVRELVKVS